MKTLALVFAHLGIPALQYIKIETEEQEQSYFTFSTPRKHRFGEKKNRKTQIPIIQNNLCI